MFRRATHGSRCVSGTRPRNSSSRALGRVTLSASFRRVDTPGDGFRGRNVFEWCSHPPGRGFRRRRRGGAMIVTGLLFVAWLVLLLAT
jgi:hypothetical protein